MRRTAPEQKYTNMTDGHKTTASASADSIPRTVAALRKPETTDLQAYWFCSEDTWQKLKQEYGSGDSRKSRNALATMKRYDAAGRIEETTEGQPARVPCDACFGQGHVCMVFKYQRAKGCGFCKRHGKSGCRAGRPLVEGASIERTLRVIKAGMQAWGYLYSELEGRKVEEDLYCEQIDQLYSQLAAIYTKGRPREVAGTKRLRLAVS